MSTNIIQFMEQNPIISFNMQKFVKSKFLIFVPNFFSISRIRDKPLRLYFEWINVYFHLKNFKRSKVKQILLRIHYYTKTCRRLKYLHTLAFHNEHRCIFFSPVKRKRCQKRKTNNSSLLDKSCPLIKLLVLFYHDGPFFV